MYDTVLLGEVQTARGAVDALTPPPDTLAAVAWDTLDGDTLSRCVVDLSRHRDRLDGLCTLAIAAHDRTQAWKADGCRSEKQWLAARCRTSIGEAAGRAETARRLARLPETAWALADGTITPAHARVAAKAVRDLPSEAVEGLDRLVAEQGAHTDAEQLRAALSDYAHRVAPEILEARQERAWATRRLNVTRTGDDGALLEAKLDKVGAETVLTALAPLAAPHGEDDARTAEQRRADALVELARRSLNHGDLPDAGGVRPHMTVIVDLPTLLGQPGAAAARLDRLGAISGETARRLACDAAVSRVIVNGPSQILDAGRATRTVTPAQRRALVVRDGGCVGCRAPAAWCEAHRPRQPPPPARPKRANGGPTDLTNLTLLCSVCHGNVHERRWRLAREPDGRWRLHPPDRQ
ncbi:MAG: DUF222 domain-containing protein [Egibacteraceae bacterium]